MIFSFFKKPHAAKPGPGNDYLLGTEKTDLIDGLAGNDTLLGLGGDDTLFGNVGADSLDGGSGNDSLRGDAGRDTLLGGGGNDILEGGTHRDQMSGGAGDDTLDGGAGRDTAIYGGNQQNYNVTFDAASGIWTVEDTAGDEGIDGLHDIEALQFADATQELGVDIGGTVLPPPDIIGTIPPPQIQPGQPVINLGEGYGQLIYPVNVDGSHWYYFWDRNGDGVAGGSGDVITTHSVLDSIFTEDVYGARGGSGSTDDTYRYATLNGTHMALPTVGEAPLEYGHQPGTAVSGTADNPTYNDLLAIWDAYNGTGTDMKMGGAPPGWRNFIYWSATPSFTEHASVSFIDGFVFHEVSGYVALEVL